MTEPTPDVRPDQADISIAVGQDANLSPAVLQALEALAAALEQSQASQLKPQMSCEIVAVGPCAVHMACQGVRTS